MYLAQSFLHSFSAALIVDTALLAWRIEAPVTRQRFRLLVIILPIVSFPLYQAISPDRGSAIFRLGALFDTRRWLDLEMWGSIPVAALFLLFLLFTAAVFLLQELLPILRHTFSSGAADLDSAQPEDDTVLAAAVRELPEPRPAVFLLEDDEPLIFSSTGRSPAIYVSQGFVDVLTPPELEAALAHEIGHISRSRRPLMVLVFLLRVLMFYNPVILMEFRRIAQEEEKICDDVAVSVTGNRAALAAALQKAYAPDDETAPAGAGSAGLRDRIEDYSQAMLIESRIARLEAPPEPQVKAVAIFLVVLATILTINYFLV